MCTTPLSNLEETSLKEIFWKEAWPRVKSAEVLPLKIGWFCLLTSITSGYQVLLYADIFNGILLAKLYSFLQFTTKLLLISNSPMKMLKFLSLQSKGLKVPLIRRQYLCSFRPKILSIILSSGGLYSIILVRLTGMSTLYSSYCAIFSFNSIKLFILLVNQLFTLSKSLIIQKLL